MSSFVLEQTIAPDDEEEFLREEAERNEEIMQLISAELKPFSDDEFNDSNGTLEDSSSEADHSLTHETNYLYNEESEPVQQLDTWTGNKQPHIQQITDSERNRQFVSHSESQRLQYDQLEVLYRAQGKQIKQLQQEVKEGEKKIRILNHHLNKFRVELDHKDSKCREALEKLSSEQNKSRGLQQNIESLENQLDSLAEARDNALADLQLSQMTVDSLQSQLNEMSRSETLRRVKRQQEEAMAAVEKRHEKEKLTLRLELDRINEILASRCEEADKLREELEGATCHLEEERLRNGDTIGKLTANLQESQMRCQQFLEAGASHKLAQLKLQLQQVTTAYQETQAEYDTLKHHTHDLERQLQVIVAEKQRFSDPFNSTMAELTGARHNQNHPIIDPDVANLRLDLDKAVEEKAKKDQQIEELQAQLVSLQRVIEGERSKNCEAEGKTKHMEVTEAHLQEARKQQSDLKETVARLTCELKKQAQEFEDNKKTSLKKCRQACLQLHNSSIERLKRSTEEQHQQEISAIKSQVAAQEKELQQSKKHSEELERICKEKEMEYQNRLENELKEMRIQIQEKAHLSSEKERKALVSENTSSLVLAKAEWLIEKDKQVKSEVDSALRVVESEWMVKQGEELRQAVEKAVNKCNTRWSHRLTETELAVKTASSVKEEVERKMKTAQEEAHHKHKLETARLKSELERLHQEELERSKQEGEKATHETVAVAKAELKRQYEDRTRRWKEEVAAGKVERRMWEEERTRMVENRKSLDAAYQASVNSLTQRYELERDRAQPQRDREMKTISTQTCGVFDDERKRQIKQLFEQWAQNMKAAVLRWYVKQRVQDASQRRRHKLQNCEAEEVKEQ